MVSLTEKALTSSDGTTIYAMAAGDRKNDALVFVHGYGLSALVFEELFQESAGLSKNFYLVAYDLRGYGRSGKPTDPEAYASALFAADFYTVLKAFDVKNPIVVPWSLGGIITADICGHLPPGTISGIAYINAVPYTSDNGVGGGVGTADAVQRVPSLFCTDDVAVSSAARILFVECCFAKPDKIPTPLKWSWIGATVVQPPAVALLVVARPQDPTKLLQAAREGLPTLLMCSTADRQIDGIKVETMLRRDFINLRVHKIENGGHTPFIEDKEEFVQVLTRFAKKVFEDL